MNRSLVVGVAILRHGRVLAARRTGPADAAGRWELPGGKVDPGETPEQAAVREIDEELGCRVRVGVALAGEQTVASGHVLVVRCAELTGGEPVPRAGQHDAVRWLGPEELDEVPWLDADRRFLAELGELLLDGDRFAEGNVGGAVRVGMTVRRPTGPWSVPVHELLEHLAANGLAGVPRVLGTDVRGREVLSYLPGRVIDVDATTVSETLLADAVRWLRRFHDTVRGFRPDAVRPWRNGARALHEGEIICHHDSGAYNWVAEGDRFVGMLDWDMAGPGLPVEDLAFMAWSAVPLFREIRTADVARRLALMAGEYGDPGTDPRTILSAVDARMTAAAEKIAAGQERGDVGMLNLGEVGEPGRTRERLANVRARVPAIEAQLDRRR